jgi:hypothetical protein
VSDKRFVIKYIAEKSANGGNAVEACKAEIAEIDEKLHEADRLKLRRRLLVMVLDHLGDDSYKRKKASPSGEEFVNVTSHEYEVSDAALEIKKKIVEAVEANGAMMVHEIILTVGGYQQDETVIHAVKWLHDQDVLGRDDEKRVIPGPKWDDRDTFLTKQEQEDDDQDS